MSYGLQILNDAGRIQVDAESLPARLLTSGYVAGRSAYLTMPYAIENEAPIILLKPTQPNSFVGGLYFGAIYSTGPAGTILVGGQHPFYYAIFAATMGTPVIESTNYGLQVFRSDNSVAYDSRHQHPNLTHMFYKPPDTSTTGGYPNTYSFSGYSEMPWILANPLMLTYLGVGETTTYAGCVMASVNPAFNQLTVDLRFFNPDFAPYFHQIPVGTERQDQNPYYNSPGWFGVSRNA